MNVTLLARKDAAPPLDADTLLDWADEEYRLALVLEPVYRRALAEVHDLTARALGLDPADFRLDDAATRRLLASAAERVVGITATTREAIREQLALGQARGYSTRQIVDGVPDEGYRGIQGLFAETWAGRAETIARSELGEAQRLSALDRYRASGLVDRVLIRDGDGDEPCASRDGTTVPLDRAPELAHPNCRLVLVPVLREGGEP